MIQTFHVACKVKDLRKVLNRVWMLQSAPEVLSKDEKPVFVSVQDEDEEMYWFNPFTN